MTKSIKATQYILTTDEEGSQTAIHLKNMENASKGYYDYDKQYLIVFFNSVGECLVVEKNNLRYVKDLPDSEADRKNKTKHAILKDHKKLVFIPPKKEHQQDILEKLIESCNENLSHDIAYQLAKKCKTLDKSFTEGIKSKKDKHDKSLKSIKSKKSKEKVEVSKSKKKLKNKNSNDDSDESSDGGKDSTSEDESSERNKSDDDDDDSDESEDDDSDDGKTNENKESSDSEEEDEESESEDAESDSSKDNKKNKKSDKAKKSIAEIRKGLIKEANILTNQMEKTFRDMQKLDEDMMPSNKPKNKKKKKDDSD